MPDRGKEDTMLDGREQIRGDAPERGKEDKMRGGGGVAKTLKRGMQKRGKEDKMRGGVGCEKKFRGYAGVCRRGVKKVERQTPH